MTPHKKYLSINFTLVSLVALLFLLFPQAQMASAEQRVLRSASEPDYPPFCIVEPDGSADGFSVELLKAAVDAVGMDIEMPVGPWHEIKQKLIDKEIDVLPLVSYSPDRDVYFDFTASYLRMHGTIFVRKGEVEIRDKQDLKNKEVLVMRGDTAHEYALREHLSDHLVLTDTFEEAMNLLSSGKHDAVIIQQLVGYQLIKKLGISNLVNVSKIEEKGYKPVAEPLSGFEQKFCFAVQEGDKELLALLNEGLAIVITNGTYNDLYDKWFGPIFADRGISLARLARSVLIVLIPLVFIGILGSIWFLRREVARKTASLREREERITLLLNSTVEGIYGQDLAGNCTFINHSCKRLLGYGEKENLLGRNMHALIHHTKPDGSEYPVTECKIHQAAQRKEAFHVVDDLLWRADGTSFSVEYWSFPIMHDGEVVGSVATFIDITERKRAEEEKAQFEARLKQAQKMEAIGTLAGGIAHDFNNILGVILGYAEMAIDDIRTGTGNEDNLKKVLRATDRAKNLVQQILTFSRESNTERIPIKIQPLIKEGLKMLRASIPTTISMSQNIDQQCGTILADPTQIHQILMNLCTNAYHAMEEKGGELSVSLKSIHLQAHELKGHMGLEAGDYVELKVSDTGEGIPPGNLEKIFDPYFTTKEVGKGTGMGLAITHGIVKEYGGAITVDSALGKGSIFRVYLPAVKQKTAVPPPHTDELHTGTERILFVDDEELLATMGKELLEKLGYDVTAIRNSLEAYELFKKHPGQFDLVVTDQTMPGLTGAELAKRMLQIRPDIPIILCTGYSSHIDEDTAKTLGIKGFALKPLTKNAIAKIIRNALDQ